MRICIRLEYLSNLLHYHLNTLKPGSIHAVLDTLLDILQILDRPDIKTKFISELVQSYYLLLGALGTTPTKILSSEVNSPSAEGTLQFQLKQPNGSIKIATMQDLLQPWIVLTFFDSIFHQQDPDYKKEFIQSLNTELNDYWQTLNRLWNSIQLLSIETPEEWETLMKIQEIFIKHTTKRIMLNKIQSLNQS